MSPAESYRRLYPHVHQPDGGQRPGSRDLLIAGLLGIVFPPIGFTAMLAYVVAGLTGCWSSGSSQQPPVRHIGRSRRRADPTEPGNAHLTTRLELSPAARRCRYVRPCQAAGEAKGIPLLRAEARRADPFSRCRLVTDADGDDVGQPDPDAHAAAKPDSVAIAQPSR